jgi:hypothetical protein
MVAAQAVKSSRTLADITHVHRNAVVCRSSLDFMVSTGPALKSVYPRSVDVDHHVEFCSFCAEADRGINLAESAS